MCRHCNDAPRTTADPEAAENAEKMCRSHLRELLASLGMSNEKLSEILTAEFFCVALHGDVVRELLTLSSLNKCKTEAQKSQFRKDFNSFVKKQIEKIKANSAGEQTNIEKKKKKNNNKKKNNKKKKKNKKEKKKKLLAYGKFIQCCASIKPRAHTLKAALAEIIFATDKYRMEMKETAGLLVPPLSDLEAALETIGESGAERGARGVGPEELAGGIEYAWDLKAFAEYRTNRQYVEAFLGVWQHIGGASFAKLKDTAIVKKIASTLGVDASSLIRTESEQDVSESEKRDDAGVNVDAMKYFSGDNVDDDGQLGSTAEHEGRSLSQPVAQVQTPHKRLSSGEEYTEPKRRGQELQRLADADVLDYDLPFELLQLCTCVHSAMCNCHPHNRPISDSFWQTATYSSEYET